MTPAMRQVLASQPFEPKLEQVAQLIATAKALKGARSDATEASVKERATAYRVKR